ncbi:calpain 2, (m II) large subunit [Lambiella insularis]|nr:calpain 2, (m II) large subunit [Lambiella insularis]
MTKGVSSQETIDSFWKDNLTTSKALSNPSSVLPSNVYAQMVGQRMPKGEVGGRSIIASYKEALKDCEAKVAQIVAECKRNNQKYSDPHFDLEDYNACLVPLSGAASTSGAPDDQQQDTTVTFDVTQRGTSTGGPISWGNVQPILEEQSPPPDHTPACAKRVGDIFDEPTFYMGTGPHVKDIRQGAEGDCWFISSLGSLCVDTESRHLIERICPVKARNEKVGVYGFVFFRDGEWISEIIDDKLYLSAPDYDDCDDARRAVWDKSHSRLDPEVSREEYRKTFQSNSDALYFGSCAHPNETWVPLLEKAFAKAHGDFKAVDGGWPGEGVEDLTGGVSTLIETPDILDKDKLWNEGLLRVNKEFLFGASTRGYLHADPNEKGRQGIEDNHAYSVLRAVNFGKHRLVLVKNPWGESEWNGPWSDGSSEWTSDALQELGHTFGNDGIFWISYQDFLRRYSQLWRTRLFTPDWNVSQHWTTVQVPWSGDYNDTRFEFVLAEPTTAVVMLSQIDARYFGGLTGQYTYNLAFRLHRSCEDVHIVRGYSTGDRSATAEVDLEAGTYEVLLQISGTRWVQDPKIEDVVKQNWLRRRGKLLRIGLSYDLAHAKGKIPDPKPKDQTNPKAEPKPDTPKAAVQNPAAPPASNATQPNTTFPPPPDPPSAMPPSSTDPEPEAPILESTADPAASPTGPPDDKPAADEGPWDASCVVGLRVFCHKTAATIRVVRPDPEVAPVEAMTKLDVDDPEKDVAEKGGMSKEGEKEGAGLALRGGRR